MSHFSAVSEKQNNRSIWNPLAIFGGLWKNKDLIRQFIKREVAARYKGSYLGIFWSFLNPLFMLAVYTFVFSIVFEAKWETGTGGRMQFALLLFCGLTTFNIFAECLNRAPGLIVGNVNYVKKVIFPLEILPVVMLGSALVQAGISLGLLLVTSLLSTWTIHWTIIFLPLVLLPLMLLCLGLGWFFASLGTFLRDIGHVVGILVQVLMFMTPIFYPISKIPERLRWIFYLSPINYVVEDMRSIFIWGQMPNWSWLLIGTILSGIIAILGYAWFQKTRGGFADVL
jgi:lipopolysaccharide transport system permease protein